MDSETFKTIISASSAVIAVVSAVLAHRSRIQTRADLFEGQRDALILAMAENDNRCSQLKLQTAFLKLDLELLLSRNESPTIKEEIQVCLRNVAEVEKITKTLDGREYNQNDIESLQYTEEGLITLRRMARAEQVNLKHLDTENYDLIFKKIESFISMYEKT